MNVNFWIDGVVILVYLVGITAIGIRAGRGSKDLKEFALGGRSMPWWAVLASIIAAETSAATFLGAPAEGYKHRAFFYAQLTIGVVLARLIIAAIFIEPYFRYRVQSIYEFLELRFGPRTRDMASAFFLIARVLGIGARLYLGGLIFAVIWKYLNPGHKVTLDTYLWGILIVTAATTAYTAIGGIKAVVWTDLIQACLMVGAVLVSIGLLVAKMGGLGAVANALGPNGFAELHWFQVGWDSSLGFGGALKAMLESPYTIFSAFIASTFTTMATHGTDQDMVQRLLTATDHKRSRLSLVVSGLADVPIALAFLAVGILLSLYYGSTGGPNIPASEIFAHYIVHEMPPGLRGLVIAGVLSTMMGSTSAALNALATSYTKDFHKPYVDPAADEQGLIGAAQWATVVFGVAMVGVALLVAEIALRNPEMTILPIAIGLLGYTFGSILGVFLVGMLSKGRGSDLGNVIAMVCGVLGVLVFCRILPEPLLRMVLPQEWPKIAWPWYVFVGTIITAAVSLLFETPESRQASLREQERLLDASENPDAQKD